MATGGSVWLILYYKDPILESMEQKMAKRRKMFASETTLKCSILKNTKILRAFCINNNDIFRSAIAPLKSL